MSRLTKLAAPAILIAMGLGTALPAQARDTSRDYRTDVRQYHSDARDYGTHSRRTPVRSANIRADIYDLRRDINRAEARRAISRREANGLRAEQRNLERRYAQLARGGLTAREVRNLQARIRDVRLSLRSERRDADRRRG